VESLPARRRQEGRSVRAKEAKELHARGLQPFLTRTRRLRLGRACGFRTYDLPRGAIGIRQPFESGSQQPPHRQPLPDPEEQGAVGDSRRGQGLSVSKPLLEPEEAAQHRVCEGRDQFLGARKTRQAGTRRQPRASKDHPPRAGKPPVLRVSLQARTPRSAHTAVATTRPAQSRGRTGKHSWRSSTVV